MAAACSASSDGSHAGPDGSANGTNADASGYANFSDTANIAGSACASNGTVTIASHSSGVANDASYYAAPGDLSSIWQGGECPMEQDCGKCVAVKCDPVRHDPSINIHGIHIDCKLRRAQQ
jgi:hypothetical protein